jgi:hypothetical protein
MFGLGIKTARRSARMWRVLSPLLVLLQPIVGCDLDNEGDAPTLGSIYFPNAIALSAATDDSAPRFLFVASSNFDLRYNAGAVHAFSLDAIDDAIGDCEQLGAEDCIVSPRAVLADEVIVPSFTTAMDVTPDGRALVVTSRSRAMCSVRMGSRHPVPSFTWPSRVGMTNIR